MCFFMYVHTNRMCSSGGISYVLMKSYVRMYGVGVFCMYLTYETLCSYIGCEGFCTYDSGSRIAEIWWFSVHLWYEIPKFSLPAALNCIFQFGCWKNIYKNDFFNPKNSKSEDFFKIWRSFLIAPKARKFWFLGFNDKWGDFGAKRRKSYVQ